MIPVYSPRGLTLHITGQLNVDNISIVYEYDNGTSMTHSEITTDLRNKIVEKTNMIQTFENEILRLTGVIKEQATLLETFNHISNKIKSIIGDLPTNAGEEKKVIDYFTQIDLIKAILVLTHGQMNTSLCNTDPFQCTVGGDAHAVNDYYENSFPFNQYMFEIPVIEKDVTDKNVKIKKIISDPNTTKSMVLGDQIATNMSDVGGSCKMASKSAPSQASSQIVNNFTKYNVVDNDLNYINSKFISLNEEEKQATTRFFNEFLRSFINGMKNADKLFNDIFVTILYAGSYYDGLKVGKPDEYDLDLIFKLPVNYNEIKITSSKKKPGYVQLQIADQEYKKLLKNQHWTDRYSVMADWFDKNNFFLPDKFRCWLQSVVQTNFNKKDFSQKDLKVTFGTTGPAVTLYIEGNVKFSVDLVPVLKMDGPPPPVVCNIGTTNKLAKKILSWYVVPKPVKMAPGSTINNKIENLNWRLAFHEHEKVIIQGRDRLKPALRLLKKFRDTQNFSKIASYYLKTICLWEVNKKENEILWTKASLTYTFVHLLKAFHKTLSAGRIDYYWQKENNLLSVVKKETIDHNCCTIKKIIEKIENNPALIPSYILSSKEYADFVRIRGTHTVP